MMRATKPDLKRHFLADSDDVLRQLLESKIQFVVLDGSNIIIARKNYVSSNTGKVVTGRISHQQKVGFSIVHSFICDERRETTKFVSLIKLSVAIEQLQKQFYDKLTQTMTVPQIHLPK